MRRRSGVRKRSRVKRSGVKRRWSKEEEVE